MGLDRARSERAKTKPQDRVKLPSQHYKCSVIVVILQGHVIAAFRSLAICILGSSVGRASDCYH
jgi:hypothetical protein